MAFFAGALTVVFFFFSSFLFCGEIPGRIAVGKISSPPALDGESDDSCWSELPEYQVSLMKGGSAAMKVGMDSEKIYILLRFQGKGNCKYSRWHWDSSRQIYVPGDEKEDVFSIIWSASSGFERGDVWLWRAALTNPAGAADDYFYARKNWNDFIFQIDQGVNSWRTKYFFAFAGERVDRFYSRAPSGSAADVKAKGLWRKGIWTVEFSRKLKTKNADDIDFTGHEKLFVVFSSAIPGIADMSGLSSSCILELKAADNEKN